MKLSTLGLIRKTGSLVFGFDAVEREMKAPDSKIKGILISNDLSPKTRKELEFARDKYKNDLNIITLDAKMSELEKLLGKKTGIIAVLDSNLWAMCI